MPLACKKMWIRARRNYPWVFKLQLSVLYIITTWISLTVHEHTYEYITIVDHFLVFFHSEEWSQCLQTVPSCLFSFTSSSNVIQKMRPRVRLGITRMLVWIWDESSHPTWPPFPQWHRNSDYFHSHKHNCVWIIYEFFMNIFSFSNYINWVTYFALHLLSTVHMALMRVTRFII